MVRSARSRIRPPAKGCGRQPAFTLVELLVVITIIGLLIGLLIPGLSAAQSYALNLQCQNNLSQIAKAVINYTADYKGAIPPTKYLGSNLYWCNLLVKGNYLSAEDTSKLGPNDVSVQKSVLRCPLASDLFVTESDSIPLPATDTGEDKAQGTARLGNPTFKVDCSYYWNGYVGNGGNVDEKAKRFPSVAVNPSATAAEKALLIHDISEIRQRTATVLAADGVLFDADSRSNRGRIAARHRGDLGERTATNIVYYDGHVEQMSRDPGEDKRFTTDPIMSAPDLDFAGAPLFMLPKR